jgi:hypothetical protein
MVTGNNFVLLHPNLGVEVKKVREIVEGIDVVVANNGDPFGWSFGSACEDVATVLAIENRPSPDLSKKDINIAVIQYKKSGNRSVESLESLVSFEDYSEYLKEKGKPLQAEPLFKPDQVVYVKPSPRHRPSHEYPSVGSQYETDVKILKSECSTFGNHIKYQTYIPKSGYNEFQEEDLILASDRLKYLYKDFKEAIMSIDAQPFFKKEEIVKIFDGYVYNKDETVVVKLNNELEKLLI